jgi:hypothetical protein
MDHETQLECLPGNPTEMFNLHRGFHGRILLDPLVLMEVLPIFHLEHMFNLMGVMFQKMIF